MNKQEETGTEQILTFVTVLPIVTKVKLVKQYFYLYYGREVKTQ